MKSENIFHIYLKYLFLIVFCSNSIRGSPIFTENALQDEFNRLAKAEEILKYMNTTADPCDDFYEFVCGNYVTHNRHGFPSNKTMAKLFEFPLLYEAKMMEILQAAASEQDTSADKKVKNFFRSCLSWEEGSNEYREKLFPVLTMLQKMPILQCDQWQESDFDWVTTVAEIFHLTGIATIFDMGPVPDFIDNSITRVGIFEPKFDFTEKEYARLRDIIPPFTAYDLNKIFNITQHLALQWSKEILDFEIALAQGRLDTHLGLQYCAKYNLSSLEDMQVKYLPEGLDTRKLLQSAFKAKAPQELYVNHRYVENALSLLKKTPPRIVANYVLVKLLQHFMDDLFSNSLDICAQITTYYFYKQLDNMLYRQYIASDQPLMMNSDIDFMWQEIKSIFQSNLLHAPHLSWMQNATRSYALKKLEDMPLHILTHEDIFDEDFEQLQLNDHDYFDNLISLALFKGNKTRGPAELTPEAVATSTGPSYTETENIVRLPVVMWLEYHKYSPSYPNAINFGAMGSNLAHELLHGFDDAGGKYEIQGNCKNWWDPQTAHEFAKRLECLRTQYKSYTFGGQHLPEMQVQAENIADNGGVRIAYAAYLKWYAEALANNPHVESSEILAGLNYTNRQLFFISYGQTWCNANRVADVAAHMASDIHVPTALRVIGPLANLEEFSKEFQCPRGSRMNPKEKCLVY